jgi:two-component system, OmpR family, sensor histidine kinase KdpD
VRKVFTVNAQSTGTAWRWPIEIAATLVVLTVSTGGAWVLFGRLSLPDVAMIYLLGVVAVAMRFSLFAAILAAVLSVLSYDFFFVPPYFSFRVDDSKHLVTFAVLFVVGVVISTLTQRIREQASVARARELHSAQLYAMNLELSAERARIAEEGEAARVEAETERLRSSLLSSVSHDLRTPLAVITGAATTLLTSAVAAPVQRDLLAAIHDESVRLTRLVQNLLDMTRLAAGALVVKKEWQSVEAVVGAALGRVEDRLDGRPLTVRVPEALPLLPFDAVLVEQALINLLENAAKHTPLGTPIEVSAAADPTTVVLEVADRGPGVPEPERSRIFEKFYRVQGGPASGAGLGLAICRGIVEAHGGRIWVADREGGGARFVFTLPIEGSPPAVEEEGAPP